MHLTVGLWKVTRSVFFPPKERSGSRSGVPGRLLQVPKGNFLPLQKEIKEVGQEASGRELRKKMHLSRKLAGWRERIQVGREREF